MQQRAANLRAMAVEKEREVRIDGLERALEPPQAWGGAAGPWAGGRTTVAAGAANAAAGSGGNIIDRRRVQGVEVQLGMATSPFTAGRRPTPVSSADRSAVANHSTKRAQFAPTDLGVAPATPLRQQRPPMPIPQPHSQGRASRNGLNPRLGPTGAATQWSVEPEHRL